MDMYFSDDLEYYENGLRAFSTIMWQGKAPDKGAFWEDEYLEPGNYGFIDREGNVVIEPKYLYVIGFDYDNDDYCIVARLINDKVRWGVIDKNGKETVPCQYSYIDSVRGNCIAYQETKKGLCGLMKYDGTVVMKPQFKYIESYKPDRKLIMAGYNISRLGVYSIELEKYIIPIMFDYIYIGEDEVFCEYSGSDSEVEFDFSGNVLCKNIIHFTYGSTGEER